MLKSERGFTLLELIVVVAIVLLLLFGSVILLKPVSYVPSLHDSQRRLDLALLAQTLQRYRLETGRFPSGIPAQPAVIGSGDNRYDLCALLVPHYIKDFPLDPEIGVKYKTGEVRSTMDACTAKDVEYVSGYAIVQNNQGEVMLKAPAAHTEIVIHFH